MAFRISRERGALTTIRLAGRLAGDAVHVLVSEYGNAAADLTGIDLSEVYYADEAGVRALGTLRARGAILRDPRPYLAMLLQEAKAPEFEPPWLPGRGARPARPVRTRPARAGQDCRPGGSRPARRRGPPSGHHRIS